MSSSIELHSAIKWGEGGVQRVVSSKETIRTVKPLMPLTGVTRIGDITGLDRIGIPVCTVFRPSAKISSVYGGKGLSQADAWVSAMMECIERYSAEKFGKINVRATYRDVTRKSNAVDPKKLQRFSNRPYTDDHIFDWVEGTDLLSGSEIMVPAEFVGFPWNGFGYQGSFQSTNGLASGNILEEAIAHALAEVIERDATTLSVVKTQLAPRLRNWMTRSSGSGENTSFDSQEPILNPPGDIYLENLPPPLDSLIGKIQHVGAHVWLKDLTTDINIPTIAAGILQEIKPGRCFLGVGFGTYPNKIIAAQRAITEAVLSRAVQVQGTREKSIRSYIKPIEPDSSGIWWVDSRHRKQFTELPTVENADILDDIRLMLAMLKIRNVSHVIGVNITDTAIHIPTIRIIVPELEFWSAFDFEPKFCSLGEKAQEYLK